jgi:hypothetical protein
MGLLEYVLVGLAALAAGVVNALAGGGTLISFPALMAVGVPAVAANVTNTVALCPGYLGAALAQRGDLRGQRRRVLLMIPASVVGGVAGGLLLLNTAESTFRTLVPWLILGASGLLAVQEPVRRWVVARLAGAGGVRAGTHARTGAWVALPVGLAAVYGGYFGAGLGVILLAVLGLVIDDTLTRLNGLKQTISLTVNVAAAVLFLFSGQTLWGAALVMAVGSVMGGVVGGRLASRVRPRTLRTVVVALGMVIGLAYLVR